MTIQTTETRNERILVIEDTLQEAECAQIELTNAGFRDYKVVSTLSEALTEIPKYNAILSDLFFPAGDEELTRRYIEIFLPEYTRYLKSSIIDEVDFTKMRLDAKDAFNKIQDYVERIGLTVPEYVVKHPDSSPAFIELERAMCESFPEEYRTHQTERYHKFKKIKEEVSNGTVLPLGLVAFETARECRIPLVIVTSTSHHDVAIAPLDQYCYKKYNVLSFSGGIPHTDDLIDGRKNWKRGIEELLREIRT